MCRKNPVQCYFNTLGRTLHRKKILVQFCLRSSRQDCTRKSPVQCCLSTPRITLHRKPRQYYTRKNPFQYCLKNPMQCFLRGSRQHCYKRSLQCCLNILRTTLLWWKSYVILQKRLQATLHREKSCSMSS